MKLVICGEAWGRHEAQFQHPLVGHSGRELTLEMGIAKLAPYMQVRCRTCKKLTDYIDNSCQSCHGHIWPNEFDLIAHWKRLRAEHEISVTNVFNVQPPENNLGHFFGSDRETEMPPWKASRTLGGTHLRAEFFPHLSRLWAEIKSLDPNLILCLGNAACWAILGQTKITTLRGTVSWSTRLEKKVLPTFHPAAALRQPSMRVSIIADLQKAALEAEFPDVRRKERWILVPEPNEAGLASIHEWSLRPASAYACDIETKRGQITMIGFARSSSDALVIPFRGEDGTNYWPDAGLVMAAWKSVVRLCEAPVDKIFQNGLYDLSYLCRMGIFPTKILHDTMLWHHALYPELPKSLGFLGSIYANEVAWKSMRHSESLKRDE